MASPPGRRHLRPGAADRRYFFEGERLYHHRAAGRELAADNSGVVRVEKRFYFSLDGTALYASKSVAGKPETVTPGEVDRTRREAMHLRQRVLGEQ